MWAMQLHDSMSYIKTYTTEPKLELHCMALNCHSSTLTIATYIPKLYPHSQVTTDHRGESLGTRLLLT